MSSARQAQQRSDQPAADLPLAGPSDTLVRGQVLLFVPDLAAPATAAPAHAGLLAQGRSLIDWVKKSLDKSEEHRKALYWKVLHAACRLLLKYPKTTTGSALAGILQLIGLWFLGSPPAPAPQAGNSPPIVSLGLPQMAPGEETLAASPADARSNAPGAVSAKPLAAGGQPAADGSPEGLMPPQLPKEFPKRPRHRLGDLPRKITADELRQAPVDSPALPADTSAGRLARLPTNSTSRVPRVELRPAPARFTGSINSATGTGVR